MIKAMLKDLTFDQCAEILKSCHYGHLGYYDGENTHVLPVTYVYRHGFMYSFTREGQKIAAMRKDPNVCLQVERVQSGFDWDSVICWGTFEEITKPEEIHEMQNLLADSYGKISLQEGVAPVSPMITELHKEKTKDIGKAVVYRINIKKTTGKSEKPVE